MSERLEDEILVRALYKSTYLYLYLYNMVLTYSRSLVLTSGIVFHRTGGHLSAILGHLPQASEGSSVHVVVFRHSTSLC